MSEAPRLLRLSCIDESFYQATAAVVAAVPAGAATRLP